MKKFYLVFLFIFISTISFSQNIISERIFDIEVEGNNITSKEFIINRSGIYIGSPLTDKDIENGIKNLFSTGFFQQVEITNEKKDSKDIVKILVVENLRLKKIVLKGNKKVKEKELLDSLTVKENDFLNDYAIFKIKRDLKNIYFKKGFLNVQINDSLGEAENGQVNLFIFIKENESVRIKKIEIIGNYKVTDKEIKSKMKTKEKGFLQDGLFKEDDFEEDKILIVNILKDKGFIDATLDSVVKEYSYDNRFLFLKIYVTLNNFYKIGKISFSGNENLKSNEIAKQIKIKEGEPYSYSKVSSTLSAIYEMYMDRGYINVNVREEYLKKDGILDIDFKIVENKLAYINEIIISGNEKTEDFVIRREILSKPGDIFKRKDLVLSFSNLSRTGYFENVQINPKQTESEEKVNIEFLVKEKQTGEFNIGGSYNQVDGLTGNITIKIKNILGKGLSTEFLLEKGSSISNFSFSFTEPYFLGYPVVVGTRVYYTTKDRTYYYDRRIGGSLTTGFFLSERLMTRFYTTYKLEQVYTYADSSYLSVLDPWIKQFLGDKRILSEISPSIVRDSRNSDFFPDNGELMGVYTGFAGGYLGGQIDYYKMNLDFRIYRKLFWKFVIMERFAYGFIDSYRDIENIPLSERFVLGGVGNWGLRGYPDRSIGYALDGYVVGGRGAILLNSELRFQLNDMAYLILFYDIGNSYNSISEGFKNRFLPLYSGMGLGVRLQIPMVGIMGIDLGYGFSKTENGYGQRWEPHFQIGTSF
ncbi:MAG: outer membrane protein assembly factor BamA [candidate division WOR-3 bacterium]